MRFDGKRHARELGIGEIRAHLSYPKLPRKAGRLHPEHGPLGLFFLYRRVLGYAMAA